MFVLTLFLLVGFLCGVLGQKEVGEVCNIHGVEGKCKAIVDCPAALEGIRTDGHHLIPRCGFKKYLEIVCCVEDTFGDRFADSGLVTSTVRTTQDHQTNQPNFSPVQNSVIQSAPAIYEAKPMRIADRECRKIIDSSPPPLESHIIGGSTVNVGEIPYMVLMFYPQRDVPDRFEGKCGGSLISSTAVMTAGHCVSASGRARAPPRVSFIRVGVERGNGKFNPLTDYNVSEVIVYPGHKRFVHDMAILKLEKPVQFTNLVHAGCLYTKNEIPSQPLTVVGFGITELKDKGKQQSSVLLKTALTYVPTSECSEQYKGLLGSVMIDSSMVCAVDTTGHDACQGDSGGPLQAMTEGDGHYRIIGIVSFGSSCGTVKPGVYTNVTSYLDWIESVVWPNQ